MNVPQETMQIGLEEIRDDRTRRIFWLMLSPLITTRSTAELC